MVSAEHPAAYTTPVGMKSLERKLMHNGERGADYFEPEWAEVRVVMRERDRYREALERIVATEGVRGFNSLAWINAQADARAALEAEDDA